MLKSLSGHDLVRWCTGGPLKIATRLIALGQDFIGVGEGLQEELFSSFGKPLLSVFTSRLPPFHVIQELQGLGQDGSVSVLLLLVGEGVRDEAVSAPLSRHPDITKSQRTTRGLDCPP